MCVKVCEMDESWVNLIDIEMMQIARRSLPIMSAFMTMACQVLLSRRVHTPDAAHLKQSVLKKLASDDKVKHYIQQ